MVLHNPLKILMIDFNSLNLMSFYCFWSLIFNMKAAGYGLKTFQCMPIFCFYFLTKVDLDKYIRTNILKISIAFYPKLLHTHTHMNMGSFLLLFVSQLRKSWVFSDIALPSLIKCEKNEWILSLFIGIYISENKHHHSEILNSINIISKSPVIRRRANFSYDNIFKKLLTQFFQTFQNDIVKE